MEKQLRNSNWRVIFWSLLDSGNNIPFMFMATYFTVYNNESYGIGLMIVGFMMGLSRLLDGITDPIIGLFIDRLNTKFGKYRPSLLIGAVLLEVSFLFMFAGIDVGGVVAKTIFMSVLYIVYIIGYTFLTATWKSGNTVITKDPKQRSMQGLYMMLGSMILITAIMAVTPMYFNGLGGYHVASGWQMASYIVVGLHMFFTVMAVLAIGNRDSSKHYVSDGKVYKLKDFVPILKENKPLRMLVIAASTNKLAATTMSATTVYWYAIILQDTTKQTMMTMLGLPVTIIATIIATVLAVKKSKKFTMLFGSWASIFAIILWVVVRPVKPEQFVLYIVLIAIITALNSMANAQVNTMIADTADYEYWKTGKSMPTMISTTFSFIDKIVSSASGFIVGIVLGLFAYQIGDDVTGGLFWSVIALYMGIPLFGHIASIWAMNRYDLDREMNLKVAREIQERKAAEEQ